ncbi:MAG: hypothetical protein JHC33_06265 [Ignisphaera sp.]|nr:hypothetical protein [Ignisphaera sp.]
MASDILEPGEERIQLSLSEENILESLRNASVRTAELVNELLSVVSDLFASRFENARVRIQKAFALYDMCRDDVEKAFTYLAKVSLSLTYATHYMQVLNTFRSLLHQIQRLLLHLLAIDQSVVSTNPGAIVVMEKFAKLLSSYFNSLTALLNSYLEHSPKADTALEELAKASREIEAYIRELAFEKQGIELPTLIALNMEEVVFNAIDLYEALLCLHLARKS